MYFNNQNGKNIAFITKTDIQNISLEQVLYFEREGLSIKIHHTASSIAYCFTQTLKKLIDELEGYGIFQICQNRLVNKKNITHGNTKNRVLH